MENGTEGQAVSPGGAEVGDLHPLVLLGNVLAPLQQRLARGHQSRPERQAGHLPSGEDDSLACAELNPDRNGRLTDSKICEHCKRNLSVVTF